MSETPNERPRPDQFCSLCGSIGRGYVTAAAHAEIERLKAELAEAKVNRDAWVRSLLVERDSAIADADLLGRAVYYLPLPNNPNATKAMEAIDARPTAAARVKGGGKEP